MNCYNSAVYLKEAIDSVISQTYRNWEIVFWDNQSKDDSASIFNSYKDSRCKYFFAPEHTSLSTARNLAIEKASGEILAFLDCDDIWMPHKLEEQVKFFCEHENVGLVYSDFELLLTSSHESAKKMLASFSQIRCYAHPPKSIYHILLRANFIIFSSVCVRKSIYLKTSGFSDKFSHNEDYELLLKCSLLSDAVCTNSKTLKYRIHATNNSYANIEIGFLENRAILNDLKLDKRVKRAININEARYLLHKFLAGHERPSLTSLFQIDILKGIIGLINRRLYFTIFKINNLN